MILSPFPMLFGTIIYFLLMIPAFFQMMKTETGVNLIIWPIVLIFLPFAGAVLYWGFNQWNKKNSQLK